jgi:hypothetical protein
MNTSVLICCGNLQYTNVWQDLAASFIMVDVISLNEDANSFD